MQSGKVAVLGLMALLILSGCAGSDKGGTGTTSGSRSTTGGPTTGPTTTGGTTTGPTTSGGPGAHLAHLSADIRNGTAPLAVTFGVKADGTGPKTWSLAFGDGGKADGTTFPGGSSHNYTAAGTFVAKLTVTYASGAPAEDSLSIGVLPSNVASPAGYVLNDTATVAYATPQGYGCVRGTTPSQACAPDQIKQLHSANAASNGTFFLWYDFPVTAGAKAFAIHAGSKAAQTCAPELPVIGSVGCEPDFDIAVMDPAGTWTDGASASDFEEIALPTPAAGTWSLVIVYFDGPPQAGAEANIGVFY